MKFIRDIIGEKRPQPRQHMGSRAGDALTEAQGEVDRAVSAPASVPEALRLEPEHRILEEAPRERMAEPAPEGVPEDWSAGAEDDYDPAEAAHGDAFTAPLEELDEVMARCAEEAPEAEPDHVAPGDRMEDTPEAVNEAAQVVSAPLEMPAQNEPIADLSQADLSAWLAKVDTPHVFGRDDVLETAASENQEADDASATDFANSLRAVKDIMGHAKEAEAEAAVEAEVEAEAEAEVALSVEAPKVPTAQSAPVTAPTPEPEQAEEVDAPTAPVDVPTPALGRGASRPGRVKTRLLGFNPGQAAGLDPLARPKDDAQSTCASFPVGWLVVVKGPGRGAAFTLQGGVAQIGRGAGQTVRLDFGDNSISRENHAAVAYDDESQTFYIGHGGKANLVRRNGRPVLSTEELSSGDLIVIGETMLKFVPLCGPEFNWAEDGNGGRAHASLG